MFYQGKAFALLRTASANLRERLDTMRAGARASSNVTHIGTAVANLGWSIVERLVSQSERAVG